MNSFYAGVALSIQKIVMICTSPAERLFDSARADLQLPPQFRPLLTLSIEVNPALLTAQ